MELINNIWGFIKAIWGFVKRAYNVISTSKGLKNRINHTIKYIKVYFEKYRYKLKKNKKYSQIIKESMEIMSKLLPKQINTLSIVFAIKYYFIDDTPVTEEKFKEIYKQIISNCLLDIDNSDLGIEFLEAKGCIKEIAITRTETLEKIIKKKYKCLFNKGTNIEKIKCDLVNRYPNQFTQTTQGKYKLIFCTQKGLNDFIKKEECCNEESKEFQRLFNMNVMTENETKNKILELVPEFEQLIKLWNNTLLKRIELTPLGKMIGIVNLETKTQITIDIEKMI